MKQVFRALVACLALMSCVPGHAAEPLTLTVPLPLTGPHARFGQIEKNAYELALEDVNAKGGVKGQPLALVFADTGGRPEEARAVAQRIAGSQPLLLGEYSSDCTKAVAEVAEARKVPYLAVTGAADDITRGGRTHVLRLCPPNSQYSSGLLSFLAEVVKPRSVAILHESSDFGASGAAEMAKAAASAGMTVLLKEQYEKGTRDFKPLLAQVKAVGPDLVYMVSYVQDAALLMRQIRELRLDARLFAGGAAGFAIPEFVAQAAEAAEFSVSATLWSSQLPYPGAREFAARYKTRFGEQPSYHAAEAHAALHVAAGALNRAASPVPADVLGALKATDMVTVFGPVRFQDRDGYQNQNFLDTYVLQVLSGEHQTIWPRKVKSADYVFPVPRWRDRK